MMSEEYIKKVDVFNAIHDTIAYNEKKINEIKEEMHEMINDDNKSIEYDDIECDYNNSQLIQQLYDETHALTCFKRLIYELPDVDLPQQDINDKLDEYKEEVERILIGYEEEIDVEINELNKKISHCVKTGDLYLAGEFFQDYHSLIKTRDKMYGALLDIRDIDVESEEKEDDIDSTFWI